MMTVDKSILERIQKLHAHATSAQAIGSEAEALAFMDGVEKLLAKYQLSMTDVEFKLEQEADPVEKEFIGAERVGDRRASRWSSWKVNLAGAVASHHGCSIILAAGTNAFWLVGRTTNRRVAEFMYATLVRSAERIGTAAYGARYKDARGYRASFLAAFAARVSKRYELLAAGNADLTADERSVALVRRKSEEELVAEFMAAQKGLTKRPGYSGSRRNLDGRADGDAAGKQVSLNANGLGAADSTKSVSAVPLRLGRGS